MTKKKKDSEKIGEEEPSEKKTSTAQGKNQLQKTAKGDMRPETGKNQDGPRWPGRQDKRCHRRRKRTKPWRSSLWNCAPPEKIGEAKKEAGKIFPVVGIGGVRGRPGAPGNLFRPHPLGLATPRHGLCGHPAPEPQAQEHHRGDPQKRHRHARPGNPGRHEDGTQTVYFNPPDKDVALYQGVFHLLEPSEARHVRLPIDFFFRSLAEDREEKAICIVLSGTGSDGTLGLEAVKGGGGLTMAQAEDQAKYPFMPRSAIDTGLVDYVLPVEQMPEELIRYLQAPVPGGPGKDLPGGQTISELFPEDPDADPGQHQTRLHPLQADHHPPAHRAAHGRAQDRGHRRLFPLSAGEPGGDPDPVQGPGHLRHQLLPGPGGLQDPGDQGHPRYHGQQIPGQPIRIWVPGCGTGEEALSLAILLDEAMERTGKNVTVQIFATDIDAEAIDKARLGEYPESIAADVSPERLKRYFCQKGPDL